MALSIGVYCIAECAFLPKVDVVHLRVFLLREVMLFPLTLLCEVFSSGQSLRQLVRRHAFVMSRRPDFINVTFFFFN